MTATSINDIDAVRGMLGVLESYRRRCQKRPLEGKGPLAKKIKQLDSEIADLTYEKELIFNELLCIEKIITNFQTQFSKLENTLSEYRESFRATLCNTVVYERDRHFGKCEYFTLLDSLHQRIVDLAGNILDTSRDELLNEIQALVAEPHHVCEVSTPAITPLSIVPADDLSQFSGPPEFSSES